MSVARQKFTASESVNKPLGGESPAAGSAWNTSVLQHSLPSDENSVNVRPSVGSTEAEIAESSFAAGDSIVLRGEGRKREDGSFASDGDILPSSVLTARSSLDQDHERSSQHGSVVEPLPESRIPRDMAADIVSLLDELEDRTLSTYEELQGASVGEDVHNVLRVVVEGFFFTQLWTDDILTFYRCAA